MKTTIEQDIKLSINKNAQTQAYPANSNWHTSGGLTKREYFAGLAMQAMLSNPAHNSSNTFGVNGNSNIGFIALEVATESIKYADELLKQLYTNP